MFQTPDAKRVKRSEALSPDHQSPSPEPATTNVPNPDYGFEYDFITPTQQQLPTNPNTTTSPSSHQDANQPPPEETFEFRLFTSTAPSTFTIQPSTAPADIPLSEGRFTHPNRPDSHYFTSATPPSTLTQLQHQYTISAISSSSILAQSLTTWPGTSLPWRVTHLKSSPTTSKSIDRPTKSTSLLKQSKSQSTIQLKPHNKPSKKRRIILRQRREARSSLKQQAIEREEAERLKRNVRNREKKIKRRERERRKKADLANAGAGAEDGDGNGSVKSEDESDEGSGDGDIKIGRDDQVAGNVGEERKLKMKQELRAGAKMVREREDSEEEESRTKAIR